MRRSLKVAISIVAVLVLFTTGYTAIQRVSPARKVRVLVAKKKAASQDQVPERQIPVVDSDTPEPADPAEREKRRIRSKRHDMRDPSVKSDDVKRSVLTERSPTVNFGGPWSSDPDEPAFPIETSDTILVGDVVRAQAYLSNDRTAIYSEFTVGVSQILKNSGKLLSPGDRIAVERPGGALRFPSGKVLIRGLLGKPLPRIDARYVFFLKRIDGDDFSITTAYELCDGHVFPLDGLSANGKVFAPFAAYQQYKGTDEAEFMTKLWSLVQSTPNAKSRGGSR